MFNQVSWVEEAGGDEGHLLHWFGKSFLYHNSYWWWYWVLDAEVKGEKHCDDTWGLVRHCWVIVRRCYGEPTGSQGS